MLLNTWGLVNTWEEPTTGGGGWRRRKKLRLKKEEKQDKKLVSRYYKGEDYELGDSKFLSKEFIEKIEQGKMEVAGVEISLQTPITAPKLALPEQLPDLSGIKDEIEREIAQIMRAEVVAEYDIEVKAYVEDMRQMEMKMYFVALALLDEDF